MLSKVKAPTVSSLSMNAFSDLQKTGKSLCCSTRFDSAFSWSSLYFCCKEFPNVVVSFLSIEVPTISDNPSSTVIISPLTSMSNLTVGFMLYQLANILKK